MYSQTKTTEQHIQAMQNAWQQEPDDWRAARNLTSYVCWSLAGGGNKETRRAVMLELTSAAKLPYSKCGITAIEDAIKVKYPRQ